MAKKVLRKHFTLKTVFAFGIAGMLASGIFLLPGLIYSKVGSSILLVYIAAGICILPTVFSKVELATAMPRSGGAYYVIDRSLGPAMGNIAGIGTWFSLMFKSSFDLIGMGAYLVLLLALPIKLVALGLCLGFTIVSLTGSKNAGRVQEAMVAFILVGLLYFLGTGLFNLDHGMITAETTRNTTLFLEAVGLVYVSFASLIKIISVAEETVDLERNLPLGMFLTVGITMLLYIAGIAILIHVLPGASLDGTLTPVADAARQYLGLPGVIFISAAAVIAFAASANAGLTAASRYPYALSRDNLAPEVLGKLGRYHTPANATLLTALFMVFFIVLLSPEGVAKLASTFLLVIFGLLNLAVIVMRESQIHSYDPGFKTPLYPWMQLAGIATSLLLIPVLGIYPRMAAGGLIVLGLLGYIFYGKKRVRRSSALSHVFSALGRDVEPEIDRFLRHNLRHRGLAQEDSLDDIIARAPILRHRKDESYQELMQRVAKQFSSHLEIPAANIYQALRLVDEQGNTPTGAHIALPHAYLPELKTHELAIIQSAHGVSLDQGHKKIFALFVLLSPQDAVKQHLRVLAELANRAERIDFTGDWLFFDEHEIRSQFIHSEEIVAIPLLNSSFHGRPIQALDLPEECLIAFITRDNEMVVPHGETRLAHKDLLTIVGTAEGIRQAQMYFTREFEPMPEA